MSSIENDAAATSAEVTDPPPAVAVDVAVTVHTFETVWMIVEIAEIPVRSKSVPAVADSVEQVKSSLPVTVKVIVVDDDVAPDLASVTVGATVSYAIESSAVPGVASVLFAESVARVYT